MQLKIDEEFKKLIPPLTEEELTLLSNNILENGILDSIKVWDGIIIDGHNRYNIALNHDINFTTHEMTNLVTRMDVVEWIINNQIGRRNLSAYDRGLLALKLQEVLKIKGKENIVKSNKHESSSTTLSNQDKVDSRQEAAKTFNVSEGTLNKVRHIEEKATEDQKKKLKDGKKTINSVYNEIVKEEKRKEIETRITRPIPECIDIYNTDKKYKVIYADPPWSYENNITGTMPKDHYKLMALDDICQMPIKNITEKNAVLYMWAVVPQLEEALKVINSWGFKYKTHFVWDKIKHNVGHYSSVRHELLMVAIKGSCPLEYYNLYDSVYSEEKTGHSVKPNFFREMIDTVYINGNRIELFARQKNEGWDFFGNELL